MTAQLFDLVGTLIKEQGGLARHRQLRRAGMSPGAIQRALGSGQLRQVARGLYATGDPLPGDALRGAVTKFGAVVSHQSAALLWGMELVAADTTPHVAVARNRSRLRHEGVVVHRADLAVDEVRDHRGVGVTSPLRTVFDLARSLPLHEAVAVADSALRRTLLTVAELKAGLVGLAPGQGRRRVARVVAMVDPASGSVLESVCRVLFRVRGLPDPVTQLWVSTTFGWRGRVDFAWPELRVVVETDGFAFHSDRTSFRNDRRRDNALQRAGWRVLRFSFEDVLHSPDYVVAAVTAVLADSAAA